MEAVRAKKPNADKARSLILQINETWEARLKAAKAGSFKAETPEVGILKAVGYHVGMSSLKQNRRRELLDQVMSDTLPFVGSPAYMFEWGQPLTRGRYRKLHRVLTVFRSGALHDERMEEAVRHWSEDLEYIEQVWEPQVK